MNKCASQWLAVVTLVVPLLALGSTANATHFPTLPLPDFAGKSSHGDYADMLVQTDAYVGQMPAALDKMGIAKDTIVIFTADNGIEPPANGDGQYAGWSGPWSGTYFIAMEGGLRVPFLIRWPGKVPANRVNNEIAHLVDLFPTLAKWTGAEVPVDRPMDGIDPRETRQVAEPYNAWLQFTTLPLVGMLQASMKKFPNIPVGAPNDFVPNYATNPVVEKPAAR